MISQSRNIFYTHLVVSLGIAGLLLLFTGWWLINWRIPLADRLLGFGAAVAAGVGAAFLADRTMP